MDSAASPQGGGMAPGQLPSLAEEAGRGPGASQRKTGRPPKVREAILRAFEDGLVSKRALSEATGDGGLYDCIKRLRKSGYRIESFHGYRLVKAP